jgi:hypothetical protein
MALDRDVNEPSGGDQMDVARVAVLQVRAQ